MKTSIRNFKCPQFSDNASLKNMVLLDIETTGLSPELSTIFMIGCARFRKDALETIQWLCDSLELQSEQEILNAFSNWLTKERIGAPELFIVTYNGQTFDLPFLHTRYTQCGLKNPFEQTTCIDLYKIFRPYKQLWPPSNMKLKSLAEWMGIHYSKQAPEGRHLIKAYYEYIKIKDSDILNLLFLHNQEDLEALASILPMYRYLEFFKGKYTLGDTLLESDKKLILTLTPCHRLPRPLNYEAYDFYIEMEPLKVNIHIPLYSNGMRYYYKDIKNYVYLPKEDYALHRSMASYIDKSHWTKACRENCYTWFSPDETFLTDKDKQYSYVQMLFELFGFL